jgi:hypothetical protein
MRHPFRTMALFSGMLILASSPRPACAEQTVQSHGSPAAPVHQAGANPLVEEMRTLDLAYRDIVSAVALGDSARVHRAVESMHGTMEKTHEGVHSGTVTTPRNAARIKDFVKMDKAFHEKLESLDRAAQRNNQREMLRTAKLLLDGCVQCHQLFKN